MASRKYGAQLWSCLKLTLVGALSEEPLGSPMDPRSVHSWLFSENRAVLEAESPEISSME
jgi:hypothetical protein